MELTSPEIQHLEKLLDSYIDPATDLFFLIRHKITTVGISIQLNNDENTSLYDALYGICYFQQKKSLLNPLVLGPFVIFDNVVTSLRPYFNKIPLFHWRNSYSITCNHQTFVKNNKEDFSDFFKRITISPKATITIKEIPNDLWWGNIIKKHYSDPKATNFDRESNHFKSLLYFCYLNKLNIAMDNLKYPFNQKITKKNFEYFIENFSLHLISNDVGFVRFLNNEVYKTVLFSQNSSDIIYNSYDKKLKEIYFLTKILSDNKPI